MAKLLNRAYERLNKVLSLAGSQAVNDIDIGTAFATHDLNAIVQSALVTNWVFFAEANTGAGTDDLDMNPEDASNFARILRNGRATTDVPDLTEEDFWITNIGGSYDANVTDIMFYQEFSGNAAQFFIPLTDVLTASQPIPGGGRLKLPTTEEYWFPGLPYKVERTQGDGTYRLHGRVVWAGAGNVGLVMVGYSLPKGAGPLR